MRYSLLLVLCFGASLPGALSQNRLAPGDIALQLQRRSQRAGVDYDAQLFRAERAYVAGDYAAVSARLEALSEHTFLDSRAIELAYRTQRAMGQDSTAAVTLREGLATYPHAVRLLRIGPSEAALRDELTSAEIGDSRRYPDALKYELKAMLAFRQNRPYTALLEAERAAYLYAGGNDLGAVTREAVAEVYARLLSQPPPATGAIAEPGIDFDEAYGRAFAQGAARLRAGGGLDTMGRLAQAAKLRAVALRLFVREGGLARWPDPMLVDLYVLDKAGHLETATMLQLAWLAPEELLGLEQAAPGRVLRARQYIREDWRAAADAYANGR